MHVLFATPEITPFSQTTELAERCAALSEAIQNYKPGLYPENLTDPEVEPHTIPNPVSAISVVAPLYEHIDVDELALARRLQTLKVTVDGKQDEVIIYEGRTPGRVRTFLLSHPKLRDAHATGRAQAAAAALFCRAVVELCASFPLAVDIVHGHGWTTGLIPVYLDAMGQRGPLADVLSVFSVHDPDDAGSFPKSVSKTLELPAPYFSEDALLLDGRVNFTQGGILFADFVVTASESLNEDLSAEDCDHPLAEAFAERAEDTFGISDGLDPEAWDPNNDPQISVAFSAERLNGKRRNKAELQHIFGLPARPTLPLVAFVGPLTKTRGADLFAKALESMLKDGQALQVVVLGRGEEKIMMRMADLAKAHPRQIGLHLEDDALLLRRVLAGADLIAFPDRQAAATTAHLKAMRYGTIPVAHAVGVLLDSIEDHDAIDEAPPGVGAGILFDEPNAEALAHALQSAATLAATPRSWRLIMQHSMSQDFSWSMAAHQHIGLYTDLLEGEEDE